jgi:uncharacterized membrane protein
MHNKSRFWEVDLLRGIAVLLMIAYHFSYDLSYFLNYRIVQQELFWFYFPRFIGAAFIFLLGVSLALKYYAKPKLGFGSYLRRGIWIFLLGMLITLVTYLFARDVYIIFGILQFAGAATIIGYFFRKSGKWNLLYGAIAIAVGLLLSSRSFDFPYLLWLGFTPTNFLSLDYYPILPWIGVVFLGIYFGEYFYRGYKRKIELADLSRKPVISSLCLFGRHSLLIYFLHQPIIFLLIWLSKFI